MTTAGLPGLRLYPPEEFLLSGVAERLGLAAPPPAALVYGRGPCVICSHPTGDCVGLGHQELVMGQSTSKTAAAGGSPGRNTDEGKVAGVAGGNPADEPQKPGDASKVQGGAKIERTNAAERQAVINTDPTEGTDAELIRADDPDALERLVATATTDELVELQSDVVEEFYYPDTKRPSYRVLYNKGQRVLRSVLDQRARDIRLARAGASENPVERLAATVDATTLAAGTWPGVAALPEAADGSGELGGADTAK